MIATLCKMLAETAAAPSTADPPEMSFSDLQKGLREHLNGQASDAHYRHLLFGVILAVTLIAVLLNLRQRKKTGGPPTSAGALFREITRTARFPLVSRLILCAVARHAKIPAAALLISRELFEKSMAAWGNEPTFTPLRNWAARRLQRLHAELFDSSPASQATNSIPLET